MKDKIEFEIKESIEVKKEVLKALSPAIERAAQAMIAALKTGHKILFFGNGGSAGDAQHLAAELISRYRLERPSLTALALTTDSSIITAISCPLMMCRNVPPRAITVYSFQSFCFTNLATIRVLPRLTRGPNQ